MEETLEEALYQIFKDKRTDSTQETPAGELSLKILTRQARETYEKAKSAAQSGNWSLYGQALDQLEDILSQLENQVSAEEPTDNLEIPADETTNTTDLN